MNTFPTDKHIATVSSFDELVSTPFRGEINAICWERKLVGDFKEIVDKLECLENITVVDEEDLLGLDLSEEGKLARDILLNDLKLLADHGAAPVLNLIKCYERDDDFFPTDVYSFHVDRSPIPSDTFLCTYSGATSEIISNDQAIQKILIPAIRQELRKSFEGREKDFDDYLMENYYDLHYQALPDAEPHALGLGHLWRLAVDHPDQQVLPCLHRAPNEIPGEYRLLLIC
jgi:hypothetical protein